MRRPVSKLTTLRCTAADEISPDYKKPAPLTRDDILNNIDKIMNEINELLNGASELKKESCEKLILLKDTLGEEKLQLSSIDSTYSLNKSKCSQQLVNVTKAIEGFRYESVSDSEDSLLNVILMSSSRRSLFEEVVQLNRLYPSLKTYQKQ